MHGYKRGQCEVPLGIRKPTVHVESRAQCVAWCFSKVCQEAELLWTLDPSLGLLFIKRKKFLFGGSGARCPGARRWWLEGPLDLAWLPGFGMCWISQVAPGSRVPSLFSLHKAFHLKPPCTGQLYLFTLSDPTQQEDSPLPQLHALWASIPMSEQYMELPTARSADLPRKDLRALHRPSVLMDRPGGQPGLSSGCQEKKARRLFLVISLQRER